MGKVLDLVDEAAANTAAIGFLQCNQIVLAQQAADLVKCLVAASVGQNVLPATGQVMVIGLRLDTHLNIEAEQSQCVTPETLVSWFADQALAFFGGWGFLNG
ncbi:hypothetical protein GCM10009109_17960 [Marinobacterium sediminicola]